MPTVYNRHRGGRIPAGAIYVGRPSLWGNPFVVKQLGRDLCVTLYRNSVFGIWSPTLLSHLNNAEFHTVYVAHNEWLAKWRRSRGSHPMENISELTGRDLVCYCAPLPCHADVLMELANR